MSRQVPLLLTLSLFILSGSIASGEDAEGDDAYRNARFLYKQERWQLAADSLGKFLKDYPKHPSHGFARLYRGLSLTRLNQHKLARTELLQFLKDNPKHGNAPDARFRAAECSLLLTDYRTAAVEFAVFLVNHPKHELTEWAYSYLGESQLHLKNPNNAEKTFRKALDEFPKGRLAEDNRFGLGQALVALGRHKDAMTEFEPIARNLNGRLADKAAFHIGNIHFTAGDFAKAVTIMANLERVFPKSPRVPAAQLISGYSHYQLNAFQKAIERFEAAAKTESQLATATYWKALSLKGLSRQRDAANVLEQLAPQVNDPVLSQGIIYQWGDSEFRDGKFAAAQKLFEQFVSRWPSVDLAGDSLYMAALSAFRQDEIAAAATFGKRFEKDFAKHQRKFDMQLLLARVDEAADTDDGRKQASKRLEDILKAETNVRTKALARLSLARVSQSLDNIDKSLDVLAPLIEQVKAEGAASEFAEALVLEAHARLVKKKFAEAKSAAAAYLSAKPMGSMADQAIAIRAESSAQLEDKVTASADVQTLQAGYPKSRFTPHAIFQVAEIAYSKKEWQWAETTYAALARLGEASGLHPEALSGVGWCQFERKAYELAAKSFEMVVSEHADDDLSPEAAYMIGLSIESAGQAKQAAAAYGDAFARFAPKTAAAAGTETQEPFKHAFDAGHRAAELLNELGEVDAADQAFTALLASFPKPKNLDAILDNWAYMHLDAENFDKADNLFKRLVAEVPNSDRADNAKLNLAESDLINGRTETATTVFKALQSSKSSDEFVQQAALFRLIGIATEAADWKATKQWSSDLKKRFPQSDFALDAEFNLADADLHLGNVADAQATLLRLKAHIEQPNVERADWSDNVWVYLAETYLSQKKYADVDATVAAFQKWDAKSKVLHQAIKIQGEAFKSQARLDDALASFTSVVNDPNARRSVTAAESQFLIGETWLLKKDLDKALVAFLTVYNLYRFPDWQAVALFQAGKCDEARMKTEQAAKSFQLLLDEFPKSQYAAQAKGRLEAIRSNK